MTIQMPLLEEGRIYRRSDVTSYIGTQTGTSDFDVMALHFPRNLVTWEHDGRGWRDGEEVVLQYQVFPMAALKEQIWQLEESFCKRDDHRKRIEEIVESLLGGSPVYPVLMQENDPQRRIIEGMHRAVALMQIESHCIPAFLAGYRNWFAPDGIGRSLGWPEPMVLDSGNGGYCFWRVDLPNTPESRALIKGAIEGFKAQVDTRREATRVRMARGRRSRANACHYRAHAQGMVQLP